MYSNTQETMKEYLDSHGIRMDAYMQSDTTMYNTEMQVANIRDLKHRSRYNASMMDVNDLEPGMDYDGVRNSYVIFICGYDPFGLGRYKYEFSNKEDSDTELLLGEGAYKIFINIHGTCGDISPELKELLDYMAGRKTAPECELDLIKEIDYIVIAANKDEKWRKEHMKLERELLWREARGRTEGRAEGKAEGRAEGRAEEECRGIYLLIKNLCSVGVGIDVAIQKASDDFGKTVSEVKEIIAENMVV